ncbi:hypothetical protein Ahy_A07g034407 [Arachis hypogaea]|uniref:Inositol polyphosphate-related phosphatase domain-containing protein n=1 Tax=Arachis hypogaea TaxID=3818 RepID=A0A445CBS1_ARAHY|nr:hypothetical protein Ahy_A07g034407 [Arachis hypogaea]
MFTNSGIDKERKSNYSEKEACNIKKSKTDRPSRRFSDRIHGGKNDFDQAQITDVYNYRIFVATWNVARKSPPSYLNLEDWLHTSPPADIYVLGIVGGAAAKSRRHGYYIPRLKVCIWICLWIDDNTCDIHQKDIYCRNMIPSNFTMNTSNVMASLATDLLVIGYSDTDVAEYLYNSKPDANSLYKYLCKDLTKACGTKPSPVPKVAILIILFSRIHRLARYYKKTKKLPPVWK